jgi:hypothetical protein
VVLSGAVSLFLAPSIGLCFSSGPPDGLTGAPGEDTCLGCHADFPLNSGPGVLSVTGPEMFEPGQTYQIDVSLAQAGQSRWGFEFTPLDIGGCTITDPTNTQQSSTGGNTYVKQTAQGTYNGDPGPVSWSFDWTAPADPPDDVTFYAAANAADGNGSTSGDYVYTASFTSSIVPVELVSFTGESSPEGVLLRWTTLTEKDNAGFRVYRSEGHDYAALFGDLVPGAGTTSVPQDYSYVDRTVEAGRVYWYKLGDVSLGGTETLHGPVEVRAGLPASLRITSSPSPAQGDVELSFTLPQRGFACVRVMDLRGAVVRELLASHMVAGLHVIRWDLMDGEEAPLPAGMYLCRLTAGGQAASSRLIVVR